MSKNPTKDDLESLMKDIDSKGQKIESINVLFLDVSSTCTGYAIADVNFTTRKVNFKTAGCIWLNDKWDHQEKYCYMYNAIVNYFWIAEQIDYIVVEQYSINPRKMMGVNVVPEMQGVIKAAAGENGVKVASILPQSWRSILKIKKDMQYKNEKVWKIPTKLKILQYIPNIPPQVISNITGNSRTTPFDLYDAVGISIAWLNRIGFNNITFSNVMFNTHIGILSKGK